MKNVPRWVQLPGGSILILFTCLGIASQFVVYGGAGAIGSSPSLDSDRPRSDGYSKFQLSPCVCTTPYFYSFPPLVVPSWVGGFGSPRWERPLLLSRWERRRVLIQGEGITSCHINFRRRVALLPLPQLSNGTCPSVHRDICQTQQLSNMMVLPYIPPLPK